MFLVRVSLIVTERRLAKVPRTGLKIEPPYNNSNMRIVPAFFLEYSPQPRYPGPGCNPKINTIYAEITMENALPTIVLTKKKKKIKV